MAKCLFIAISTTDHRSFFVPLPLLDSSISPFFFLYLDLPRHRFHHFLRFLLDMYRHQSSALLFSSPYSKQTSDSCLNV